MNVRIEDKKDTNSCVYVPQINVLPGQSWPYEVVPIKIKTIEFFQNVFTEFAEFSGKIFIITVKGLEPAAPATVPVRHI